METERIRYIYCITNLVNGKTYIGQRTRGKKYKSSLKDMYWGSGKLLKKAFEKYGKENFKKEIIIEGFFTKEQINRFERCMIACQRICGKAEYNLADGGEGGDTSKFINYNSTERSSKLRESTKKRFIEGGWQGVFKGHHVASFKGKRHSDETKKKMSEKASLMTGSKNSSFGKVWWTNGKDNVKSEACPDGFWKGRTIEKTKYLCVETGEIGDIEYWSLKGFNKGNFYHKIKLGKYKGFTFIEYKV